jgi:hypothetical protein
MCPSESEKDREERDKKKEEKEKERWGPTKEGSKSDSARR